MSQNEAFHVGVVYRRRIFDNNILGMSSYVWPEVYEVAVPAGFNAVALMSLMKANQLNFGELKVFNIAPPAGGNEQDDHYWKSYGARYDPSELSK